MSTALPTPSRAPTDLRSLPRPRSSAAAWAKLFFAPERARQEFAGLGERFVLDVPLLPTMLWTSGGGPHRLGVSARGGATGILPTAELRSMRTGTDIACSAV